MNEEWITEQNNRKSLFKKLTIPCLHCGKMGRWDRDYTQNQKQKVVIRLNRQNNQP